MCARKQINHSMTYIYETPDSGKTLYRRKLGSNEPRELVREDTSPKTLWEDIQKRASRDPALQEAVDMMLVYYQLSRDNDTI